MADDIVSIKRRDFLALALKLRDVHQEFLRWFEGDSSTARRERRRISASTRDDLLSKVRTGAVRLSDVRRRLV
jgi:hypothetical protein